MAENNDDIYSSSNSSSQLLEEVSMDSLSSTVPPPTPEEQRQAQDLNRNEVVRAMFNPLSPGLRKCLMCRKHVKTTSYDRFIQHLENCPSATDTFRDAMRKKRKPNLEPQSNKLFQFSNLEIDKSVRMFFYSTGAPFSYADSFGFRNMVHHLNPSYNPPSSKTIGSTFLEKEYKDLKINLDEWIAKQSEITIISDGWSNQKLQHIVNYVLVNGKDPPMFHSSINTGKIPQTGENIAADIKRVMLNIGVDKVIGVVTDNASCNISAWNILREDYPKLIVHGCFAHLGNILLKNIFQISRYDKLLQESKTVVMAVRTYTRLQARFEELNSEGIELVLPTPTRWYSNINCIHSVLRSKSALFQLVCDEEMIASFGHLLAFQQTKRIVMDEEYWKGVAEIGKNCNKYKELVMKYESDHLVLSDVLPIYFSVLDAERDPRIINIVVDFMMRILTPEVIQASFFNPVYQRHAKLPAGKWLEAITHLRSYSQDPAWYDELKAFQDLRNKDSTKYVEFVREYGVRSWWNEFGYGDFPLLGKYVKCVLSIPASSASAERVWKIFNHLHSKSRNRLTHMKLDQLVFLYANQVLREKQIKCEFDDNDSLSASLNSLFETFESN